MKNIIPLILGVLFGLVLSRSGAADYGVVQQMFLLQHEQLYGIIGVAVAVVAPGLWLLKRFGKTATGQPLVVKPKPANLGNIIGGVFFGAGWAVAGMCPGPMIVNIGEGKLYALAAFPGALVGAYLVGLLYDKLRGPLNMPAVVPATQVMVESNERER